jgi:hypothetical protein
MCQSFAKDTNVKLLVIECEIVKIDSVGNYYVIYAKDSLEKYKIVSEKDSSVGQNIVVGQSYTITLDPPILPPMNIEVPVTFPDGSLITLHDWGNSLYFALDIKGLCHNIDFKNDILKERKERK